MTLISYLIIGALKLIPNFVWLRRRRYIVYNLLGAKCSKCFIVGELDILPEHIKNIELGNNAFINTGVRVGAPSASAKVVIGDSCAIGPRVCFETVNHGLVVDDNENRGSTYSGIELESNVWLGCGVIVCPGVKICAGTVVAAGSVVTKSINIKGVYGGIPAKLIKNI